jgi:hypothetical protein
MRRYKLWEKRSIGGDFGAPIERDAKSAHEAAEAHCKDRGYRTPTVYTNDTFKVQVNDGARVFFHYIRVAKL